LSQLREIAIKLMRGELPPLSDGELEAERLKVCDGCEHFRALAQQCKLCGCFMTLKVKLLESACPANKW
jgi:hypothetical protein